MSTGMAPDDMAGMIRREIEYRINELIKKEISAAQENIDREIRNQLGNIVTAVAAEYEYRTNGTHLIITVKNRVS